MSSNLDALAPRSDQDNVTAVGSNCGLDTAWAQCADTLGDTSTRKRKPLDPIVIIQYVNPKRAKLLRDGSQELVFEARSSQDTTQDLPVEIWQRIFIFLPPRCLGRLLTVNKLFHQLLDPTSPYKTCSAIPSFSVLRSLEPNLIWRASRRMYWPRMPAPLEGRSELSMWRVVCSRACQFCLHRPPTNLKAWQDCWHHGPGDNAVSPIFPFFVACCGKCLAERSLKELDIFLSSSIPSVLLHGLAPAFITPELHVVSSHVIQTSQISIHHQITKIFWKEQVNRIKSEFDEVSKLGSAATEEWVKGLESRGKAKLRSASRWEQWSLSGGVKQMQEHAAENFANSNMSIDLALSTFSGRIQGQGAQNGISIRETYDNSGTGDQLHAARVAMEEMQQQLNAAHRLLSIPLPPTHQQKRTKEETMELKTRRRTEIERRAALLSPPITPNILAHIPSFHAAIQILTPLDDHSWKLLEGRLLAQREVAEQKEQEVISNRTIHAKVQAVTDAEWDKAQGPVRARLSEIADHVIKTDWKGGRKVTKHNCYHFAPEVLLRVRYAFYREVAEDTATKKLSNGSSVLEQGAGPWTRKLTVENLKWVYDEKVKPIAEPLRKDLFLCNGCDNNSKYYGLGAVIQHYAAKHTNMLSIGNVVVHWRAEWPETPIFKSSHNLLGGYITTLPSEQGTEHIQSHPNPKSGLLGLYTQQPSCPAPSKHDLRALSVSLPVPSQNKTTIVQEQDASYMMRLDLMAKIAKEAWLKVGCIRNKKLPNSVKVLVVIHQIVKAFRRTFSDNPTLDMFIEGLSHRKELQCICTGGKGLVCKTCEHSNETERTLSLPELTAHFSQHHSNTKADWYDKMVTLPSISLLRRLLGNLTEFKPALISVHEALTWAFEGSYWLEELNDENQAANEHYTDKETKSDEDSRVKAAKNETVSMGGKRRRRGRRSANISGVGSEGGIGPSKYSLNGKEYGKHNSHTSQHRMKPDLKPASMVYGVSEICKAGGKRSLTSVGNPTVAWSNSHPQRPNSQSTKSEHPLEASPEASKACVNSRGEQSRSPPVVNRASCAREAEVIRDHYRGASFHDPASRLRKQQDIQIPNGYQASYHFQDEMAHHQQIIDKYGQPLASAPPRGHASVQPHMEEQGMYYVQSPHPYAGNEGYRTAVDLRGTAPVQRCRSTSPAYELPSGRAGSVRQDQDEAQYLECAPSKHVSNAQADPRNTYREGRFFRHPIPGHSHEIVEAGNPQGARFITQPSQRGIQYIYDAHMNLGNSSSYGQFQAPYPTSLHRQVLNQGYIHSPSTVTARSALGQVYEDSRHQLSGDRTY